MEIKNIFSKGKLNKDVDERIVPNGEYTDALNIRVTSTDGSDAGTVQNIKGNTQVTRIDTTDNPVCIGSVADDANEKLYWFVVDDNGSSFIYEYDNKNNVTSTVLSDTRAGSDQVLGFDVNHKITGVNVIFNKTTNDSLLLFTDNLNPPRMLNVNRAKAYGQNNFEEDDINLYKKPPRKAPVSVGFNTASDGENAVLERFFSFAYRYKYLDGEYSALSAFTYYQFTPRAFDLDFLTMENLGMQNTFNAYNITYNTGDKRVTDIQLCFKTPLSDVVFIADTINKEENDFLDNVERTYSFTNKKVYQSLPDDELNRVFDNVPLKALAQDIIEDRIVFGNYTTQYDMVENEGDIAFLPIDYVAEKVTKQRDGESVDYTRGASNTNIIIDLTGKSLIKGYKFTVNAVLDSAVAGTSPNTYFDGDFQGDNSVILSATYTDADDFASSDDMTSLLNAMNSNFKANVDTESPDNHVAPITYGTFVKSASTATTITITAPVNTHRVDNTPLDETDNDFTDYTEAYRWVDTTIVELLEESNTLSLKSNRSYDFGIVYLDKYGRYSSVIPNSDDAGSAKSNFFVPTEDSVNLNSAKITIKSKPPYWADRYKFFVKSNKGVFYNIYATTFYEEGQYVWVLLNGNNLDKVEAGMNLIVKSDDNGPMQQTVKVKVLEVTQKTGADVVESDEGWIIGNVDSSDENIKEIQGTFMKIRPEGFTMDYNENNFLQYSNRGIKIAAGQVETTLPEGEERGLLQSYSNSTYSSISLTAGTRIYFKFNSWDSRDQDGDETRYYERDWIVQNDYNHSTGTQHAIHQFLDAETNWTHTNGVWEDPNDQFILQFFEDSVTGRRTLKVKSTEFTQLWTERGHIRAKITIQRNDGVVIFETDPIEDDGTVYYETAEVFDIENGYHLGNTQDQTSSQDAIVDLNFGNCFSFGNGVESVSVRDERFGSTMSLDYRPNISLIDGYHETTHKHGLIYSGSYNENSSYNSLNEFNTSRGNTKFMDLKYGSIQKLHTRETDLICLQEDQVSKILFGKSILTAADGTASLTQIEQVLGQVVPFAGEYGIAKNPESFAEHGGRLYFTDALRGAVLRLSTDGLSPISTYGMQNYFRTTLPTYVDSYNLGGFDVKYGQYVLSMNQASKPEETPEFDCATQFYREVAAGQTFTYNLNVGENAGALNIAYDITGTADIDITYDGTTSSNGDISGTGTLTQQVTSANLLNTDVASVVVTGVTDAKVELTHTCPVAGTREIIVIVLNDANDAGKTIINRYKVGNNNYYTRTDTFAQNEIARNETMLGIAKNPYIPVDGSVVTMSSYKDWALHTGYLNSCNGMGYLVTDAVKTVAQVQSEATYLTETAVNEDDYREVTGSFTFSPTSADDKLYLIYDYQDGDCTPLEEEVASEGQEQGGNTE